MKNDEKGEFIENLMHLLGAFKCFLSQSPILPTGMLEL